MKYVAEEGRPYGMAFLGSLWEKLLYASLEIREVSPVYTGEFVWVGEGQFSPENELSCRHSGILPWHGIYFLPKVENHPKLTARDELWIIRRGENGTKVFQVSPK